MIDGVAKSGTWDSVKSDKGPIKALDVVSRSINFKDLAQCSFLNYSISYYLDGGK